MKEVTKIEPPKPEISLYPTVHINVFTTGDSEDIIQDWTSEFLEIPQAKEAIQIFCKALQDGNMKIVVNSRSVLLGNFK